jgi:hypothetical protein
MITDDNKPRNKPRPARGFPEAAPPGFAIPGGRSFILVGADYVGRFFKRWLKAVKGVSTSHG